VFRKSFEISGFQWVTLLKTSKMKKPRNPYVDRINTIYNALPRALTLAIFLIATSVGYSETIKWKGGTPNGTSTGYEWTNADNWECTSCSGPPYNIVPTIDDDVIFDLTYTNSYTLPVLISTNASCRDMTWSVSGYTGTGFPELKGESQSCVLNIAGNLALQSTTDMTFNLHTRQTTNFKYGTAANRTIDMSDQVFPGRVVFEESTASWSFLSDFNATYIVYINSGAVAFPSVTTIYVLKSEVTGARTLNLTNANVEITGYGEALEFRNTSLFNLVETNSTIQFTNTDHLVEPYADNLDFNDMHFEADVHAELTGVGNTFNTMKISGEVLLVDANEITTLELDPGSLTMLQPSHTQEVGDIVTTGSCGDPALLQSLWSGTDATIDWTGGTSLTLNYLYIEDVVLTNFPTISGVYYNLTGSAGWGTTTNTGLMFEWNAGSGNWNDASNWLANGSATTCVPGPNDDVFFGPLVGVGATITVDESNVYCRDMDWVTAVNTPTFVSTDDKNTVNVYGSMALPPSSSMTFSYDGNIEFRAHSVGKTLNFSNHSLEADFQMNGSGGEWTFLTNLETSGDLEVDGGSFKSNGFNFDGKAFRSKARNTREVHLESSSVFTVERWDMSSKTDEFNASHSTTVDPYLIFTSATSEIYVTDEIPSTGVGLTYYDFTMTSTNTGQKLQGYNSKFHDLIFECDANLHNAGGTIGIFEISNLIYLNPGNEYSYTGTIELGASANLSATGSCTNYIEIVGGTFEKLLGSAQVANYCIITDNAIASGSVSFTANNSVLTNSPTWGTGAVNCDDFHFRVGTTNDWSDINNWFNAYPFASPAGCIPGPGNNVYFHEDSFDGTFPDMDIDVDNAYCRDIVMVDDGNPFPVPAPKILGQPVSAYYNIQELNIFGSIEFLAPTDIEWVYEGQIRLRHLGGTGISCPSPTVRTIESNGQAFYSRFYIEMDPLETARLVDDMQFAGLSTVEMIWVNEGTFDLNEKDIDCYGLISQTTGNQRAIDMTNSTVDVISTVHFKSTLLTYTETGSVFNIGKVGSVVGYLISDNLDFNEVNFVGDLGTITNSGNTFQEVTFSSDGYFNGSNSFEVLNLTADNTYEFEGGKTQTITNNSGSGALNAIGVQAGMIIMESADPGQQSHIESEVPVCLDYVQMRDMTGDYLPGNDALVAENSINVENNTGWSFSSCTYTVIEGCVGEAVVFDMPIPALNTPTWYFGDGTSITANSPAHNYATAGTYTATVVYQVLGTSGGTSYDAENFTVIISQSCCDVTDFPDHTPVSGNITSDVVWGDQIIVTADVFVKNGAKLDITNSDVVFFDNTGIYVEDDSRLVTTNSTLRPCDEDETWSGIDFDDSSGGQLTDNTIIQPEAGIELNTTGIVDIVGNQFVNFHKGVFVGNSSSTMMEHMISGNDFTLNRSVDNLTYPATEFYGIMLEDAWVSPAISMNDFHYTFFADGNKEGYGVYVSAGAATVTDNSFTNVIYPYFQINSTNVCAFESNTITYNASFGSTTGSMTNDPAGITIDGGTVMTSVFNNELTSTSSNVSSDFGVYVHGTMEAYIVQNVVDGFKTGISAILSTVEIEDNTLTKCSYGISVDNTEDALIKSNEVNESTVAGILLNDCFENVDVIDNVVDAEWGVAADGIMYNTNGAGNTAAVDVESNCVLDCERSMVFISTMQCTDIPRIRNNYLYNYGSTGIHTENFQGDIGVLTTDHGKNSFISNTTGALDINNPTQPFCMIFAEGNWPSVLNFNSGPIPQTATEHSTSSCGRQTAPKLVLASYLNERIMLEYGVRIENGVVSVTDKTAELIASKDEQFMPALTVLRLLLANEDVDDAHSFVEAAEANFNLGEDELSYLRAQLDIRTNDWNMASAQYLSLNPSALDEVEVAVEAIKLGMLAQDRNLGEYYDEELDKVVASYQITESAYARAVIHECTGDNPHVYEQPQVPSTAGVSNALVFSNEEFIVYPNPAQEMLNLRINAPVEQDMTIRVADAHGRVVSSESLQSMYRSAIIDVSTLTPGIYFVSVTDGTNTWRKAVEVLK